MDIEKDDFELELEKENEGYELVLENKTEEIAEKSKILRIKKLPKVRPEIKVDFAKSEVSLYVIIPKIELVEASEKEKKKGFEQAETLKFTEKLSLKRQFNFSNNQISIGDKTYSIPFYFNSDLILKKDENTWERLFFRILINEIQKILKTYN